MDFTDKVTIIIITFNRYPFLLRLLKFYQSYGLKSRIVVLDSSSDMLVQENLKELLSLENISWHKFDSDIFFVQKIAQGLKDIATPYCVLCADDDFLIPSAICECAQFLDQNPDYSSAHGIYFSHTNAETARRNGFRLGELYVGGCSVVEGYAKDRVHFYLSGKSRYVPFFAVHRSDTFRLIWKESANYVSDWGLSELFPCCLSLIYGKMKVLPVFYSSREQNYYSWYDEDRYRKMYSREKLELAIEGVAKHLTIVDGMDFDEAALTAQNAFEVYLNRVFKKHKQTAGLSTGEGGMFYKWIKMSIPFGVKMRIKRIIFRNRWAQIVESKNSIFYADYVKVKDAITSEGLNSDALDHARQSYSEQKDKILG